MANEVSNGCFSDSWRALPSNNQFLDGRGFLNSNPRVYSSRRALYVAKEVVQPSAAVSRLVGVTRSKQLGWRIDDNMATPP
jgi:hypothetical protein